MHRGDFSILSRNAPADSGLGIPVTGEACFSALKAYALSGDAVFEFAVRDAISKAAETNALAQATFEDTGACVQVKGLAVTR
jgi:hypothetical protein